LRIILPLPLRFRAAECRLLFVSAAGARALQALATANDGALAVYAADILAAVAEDRAWPRFLFDIAGAAALSVAWLCCLCQSISMCSVV
jgi:hypothetical protein